MRKEIEKHMALQTDETRKYLDLDYDENQINLLDMGKIIEIDDAIFEFELMASDKCNGDNCKKYAQIAEWLKELKEIKEKNNIRR